MTDLQPPSQVYIVRIWQAKAERTSWRGVIQNVRTGESVSASNLNQLEKLIRRCFHEREKDKSEKERGLR